MTHEILLNQNNPDFINLLKASSVAYKNAKSKEFVFTYTLMFLAIAYPVVYIFIETESVKEILFAVSFLVSVSTWFLTDYFKGNTSRGAILKEEFDVRLFKIPWPFLLKKTDRVEIMELAGQYKGKDIQDWYPVNLYEKIPNNIAIGICQRISSAWDVKLRKRFKLLLQQMLFIYTVFVMILWTVTGVDGRTVFLMYFSTLSFYSHVLTLIRGNSAAIKKRLTSITILDDYIENKKQLTSENLRDIQNELYNIRQEPAKVPDFISERNNKKIQKQFEEYVEQINRLYL